MKAVIVSDTGATPHWALGSEACTHACTRITTTTSTSRNGVHNNPPAGAFRGFESPRAALLGVHINLRRESRSFAGVPFKNAIRPGKNFPFTR